MSGLVVAIALFPEAIGFSLLAGLNPMVGLYASFCIAIVTAIAGGRPGMISGATGAMALVMGSCFSHQQLILWISLILTLATRRLVLM